MSGPCEYLKIKDQAEFKQVIGHGQRIRKMFVTLYYKKTNSDVLRIGLSVTRGVRRAVDRNRLRRRSREAINSLAIKRGCDMVIVVSASAAQKNFWEIREAIRAALDSAEALEGDR